MSNVQNPEYTANESESCDELTIEELEQVVGGDKPTVTTIKSMDKDLQSQDKLGNTQIQTLMSN